MSQEKEKPNYYSITPASVRYDKKLKPLARLLYGEITALCNQEGYCWAKNSYFAGLYEVDERSVTRWIKDLEKGGYIKIKMEYKENSKEIKRRLIFIADPLIIQNLKSGGDIFVTTPPDTGVTPPGDKNVTTPPDKNVKIGGDKNVVDNNKLFSTNSFIFSNKKSKVFIPPTLEEIKNYCYENSYQTTYEDFYKYYSTGEWKDSNDKPVKNWKQKLITWANNPKNFKAFEKKQNPDQVKKKIIDEELENIKNSAKFEACQFNKYAGQHLNFENIERTEKGFKILASHPKAADYKPILNKLNIELQLNN